MKSVRRMCFKALVGTGATFTALPDDKVEELGLPVMKRAKLRWQLGRRR